MRGDKNYKKILPVKKTTAVTMINPVRIRIGVVFQIAFVDTYSLPWSIAAVELAAGVRKARQHDTVTKITGCSASIPFAVQ